jgi:hypothetical protein
MTKTSKAILANCIMQNADKFPHPVLGVHVTARYVYILTKMPEGPDGEGECVCYEHHCNWWEAAKRGASITTIALPDVDEDMPPLVH